MRLDDGDFDDGATFGYRSPVGRDDATAQLSLGEDDMRLVNQIIQDSRTSPSKYHHMPMTSNIPSTGKGTKHVRTLRQHRSQLLQTCTAASNYLSTVSRNQGSATHRYVNPRSSDLLEKQSHMFTDEKPFVPRTLKTNCTSKLTEFKYYNPPPKKHGRSARDAARDGADLQRSETPMTESVELMNETLMSRGAARVPPSGIPPLDISLDADHLLWLKEQSKNAQLRKTNRCKHAFCCYHLCRIIYLVSLLERSVSVNAFGSVCLSVCLSVWVRSSKTVAPITIAVARPSSKLIRFGIRI